MRGNDPFITDVDQILDVLDATDRVFLYDTVALSAHELAFHRFGDLILKRFCGERDTIVITITIRHEMRFDEDVGGRYRNYLQQFDRVLLVRETDFFQLVERNFAPLQKARAKFKKACLEAFSSIQQLVEACNDLDVGAFQTAVCDLFDRTFASNSNRNKGGIPCYGCLLFYG